jgi:probable addiction module antidote protein
MGHEPDIFDPADYLTEEATIASYLNACLELDDPALLLSAIGDVAKARGMTELARQAGLGRESLYKALVPGARPRYDTIFKLTRALGVHWRFEAAPAKAAPQRRAAASTRRRSRSA